MGPRGGADMGVGPPNRVSRTRGADIGVPDVWVFGGGGSSGVPAASPRPPSAPPPRYLPAAPRPGPHLGPFMGPRSDRGVSGGDRARLRGGGGAGGVAASGSPVPAGREGAPGGGRGGQGGGGGWARAGVAAFGVRCGNAARRRVPPQPPPQAHPHAGRGTSTLCAAPPPLLATRVSAQPPTPPVCVSVRGLP